MKIRLLLLLGLGSIALPAKDTPPKPEQIDCRGIITSFEKEGFSGTRSDGGHEVFDVTWVSVTFPKEYAGVRQMLFSGPGEQKSPFGKIGDEIVFRTYKVTLESEKESNKRPEPMAVLGPPMAEN